MSTGKGLICKLGQHQEIEGADRIVQVDMFGETVITQKTNEEGTIGILFDCETQLSKEYAGANNMFRHSDLNVDKEVVGYMADNARVKPIKLKGVKCSGLFMPLDSLSNLNIKIPNLDVGQEIDSINGVQICKKYISPKTERAINKQGKVKENLAPTFKEHLDTDQWGRNSHKVKEGNLVIITEKLHGTSGRCGYLPVIKKASWNLYQKIITAIMWFLIDGRRYNPFKEMSPDTDYEFVVGSRRVVKSISGEEISNKEHYYDEDLWTKVSKEYFEGKLRKGETIYFEIVGYTPSGELIMGRHSNEKLKNFMDKSEYKEFTKKYGEETKFTYGLYDGNYEVYVYRITTTNEDGDTIDYSWEQVKNRCDQMGVNHVPELYRGIAYNDIEGILVKQNYLKETVNTLTESDSSNFPQHIKEGVCVRVENGNLTPMILKNKAFIFKALEGIIKDNDVVDIEESN